MEITGTIKGISYQTLLQNNLTKIPFEKFDINNCPSSCNVEFDNNIISLSKWVSPKRTRSYPYERVYNTLVGTKKITVIPIVKDEGQNGDRDFIQWDTVSLMSLLDVFVIFAYYADAERKGSKITKQKFDNDYVLFKIKEIQNYHSSALHWNLRELKESFHNIIDLTIDSYKRIESKTGVKLHNIEGIENFKNKIGARVDNFMNFSRTKAKYAQSREIKTMQPKEQLISETKATVTINNYLGGLYYFTVDEVELIDDKLFLIEAKHSSSSLLPSLGDIKDGLLKLILYSNLSDVKVDNNEVLSKSVLRLTSNLIKGNCRNIESLSDFIKLNKFNPSQQNLLKTLFLEGEKNNINIEILNANNQ